jgi:hypothetical protein
MQVTKRSTSSNRRDRVPSESSDLLKSSSKPSSTSAPINTAEVQSQRQISIVSLVRKYCSMPRLLIVFCCLIVAAGLASSSRSLQDVGRSHQMGMMNAAPQILSAPASAGGFMSKRMASRQEFAPEVSMDMAAGVAAAGMPSVMSMQANDGMTYGKSNVGDVVQQMQTASAPEDPSALVGPVVIKNGNIDYQVRSVAEAMTQVRRRRCSGITGLEWRGPPSMY